MSDQTEKNEQELKRAQEVCLSVDAPRSETYSLDDILAEFGSRTEAVPEVPDISSIPEPAPLPRPAVQETGEMEAAVNEEDTEDADMAPEREVPLMDEPQGEPEKERSEEPAEEMENDSEEEPERPHRHWFHRAKKAAAQKPADGDEPAISGEPSFMPEEPEGPQAEIPLEQVMSETVEAVLGQEDDEILEKPRPLRNFFRRRMEETEEFYENPHRERREKEPEPEPEEPSMDDAARTARWNCKRKHKMLLPACIVTLLLLAATALDYFALLPALWTQNILLRCGVLGGGLLVVALLCGDIWKSAVQALKTRQGVTLELCAGILCVVTLGDCAAAALLPGHCAVLPFAAAAALLLVSALYGQLQGENARRESFHLLSLGGEPPYTACITEAGAAKQRGVLAGFYNCFESAGRNNPARRWQQLLLPLVLSATLVLTGVVCLTQKNMNNFLWCWSALLTASLPLSFPLACTLPVARLAKRLAKSGCVVAGYSGARQVGRGKSMVVTDADLFPPGTVGLNGIKVFGEEIGKVVAYAATMAKASGSQLLPLFEQLLISEGGAVEKLEGLNYYEEGGVSGTIRGETVLMGTAYFMKKMRVSLPTGLKLQTGMFLASDSRLIAIFAIKYQPSRNVEWALRAMRRNHFRPVLAVRDGNVTPGLLKRKFQMETRSVYPNISARLALSQQQETQAQRSCSAIYREGLMPFAETVIGSSRCWRAVRDATALSFLGSLCGLLLSYYLTYTGSFSMIAPLPMLAFLLLWLLPCLLVSGWVKHY